MMEKYQIADGNHDYQQKLAECLIHSLGADEAIRVALENSWDGVIAYIRKAS